MDRRRFFSTSVSATLFAAISAAKPFPLVAQTSNKTKTIRKGAFDLPGLMDVTHVPGIAVVGKVNGHPIAEFSGAASTVPGRTEKAVAAETIFPAASLSKVVFAWAVAGLVRQGKLEWHKPLIDYLPSLALDGEARRITAEHVLSHTTGLPNWRFKDEPLVCSFTPGTRWLYSGEGIFLLQRVIERIVGASAATFMKREVLPGVGIRSGSFAWEPGFLLHAAEGHDGHGVPSERNLTYYEKKNYEFLQSVSLDPTTATVDQMIEARSNAKQFAMPIIISPNMAGSLWLKPVEYADFMATVMADLATHPENYRAVVEVNKKLSWSRSWALDHSLEQSACWAYGDGPGTKNFAWIQPEMKTAVAIFTNGDHGAALYGYRLRNLLNKDPAVLYWV